MENLKKEIRKIIAEDFFLKEDITINDIKDIYSNLFKQNGINVKKIKINEESDGSYIEIELPGNINFLIKWLQNPKIAQYFNKNINKGKVITNPNAQKVVTAISKEYQKIVKKQNLLKKLISFMINESKIITNK